MAILILQRHLQSQWNLENRFSGWVDIPLSREGREQAREIAEKIAKHKLDVIYTSPLIRNIGSVVKVFEYISSAYPIFKHFHGKMKKWGNFENADKKYIPAYVAEELNERYYGDLQGMNKEEIMKKYGEQKVRFWRRSFEESPPGGGENLKTVASRVVPFYKRHIEKDLKKGKNVFVVASHNSLRAIIKYVEMVGDNEIINVEIPFGGTVVYEFDGTLKMISKKVS